FQDRMQSGLSIFLKNFLQDGFFHADLHSGNFILLDSGKIGIIDFGLMGHLSKKGRQSFITIMFAIVTNNFENLVYEFLDVAEYDQVPDVDTLIADVRDSLSPILGLSLQQINSSKVFRLIIQDLTKHHLYLPRDWYTVFRALITLDGLGRTLDLDFDLLPILEKELPDLLKNAFTKEQVLEESLWAARDIITSMRVMPRHLRWFFKEWSKRNYAFEVVNRGYEHHLRMISSSLIFLGGSVLTGILVLAGIWMMGGRAVALAEIPPLSWISWAMAASLFFTSWVILLKDLFLKK
ncbi:MAG: AarF/UbiB family protein, partial [Pseudomonadota bacterium]